MKAPVKKKTVAKKTTVKKFEDGGKKKAPAKSTGVVRKATEDPNYARLQERLNPKSNVRKATEDPNYARLKKRLDNYKVGGTKGKKK